MTTKTEQAYDILRTKIMDGALQPGDRVVIDQLGREHGISSVPWRESLRRLEAEGWVDIIPNAGAVVKTYDAFAWARSIRLLSRIEGLATALSAPHLTDDDFAHAKDLNRQMGDALANFDTVRFGRLNRTFHEVLCSRCDDARLLDLVMSEWARMDVIRRAVHWNAPGRAVGSLREHAALLDLIDGGVDADLIETAARRHEMNTLEAVLAHDEADSPAVAG
ncbi:GntR family transcriptional regulator [Herbiconiux sp. YIM B11900]|uniref:GntR family transcriptional regulator n=1 Tax=Herbiconiux sp. YIM B11900 TaxID=3404131 RepID=UPI003F864AC4